MLIPSRLVLDREIYLSKAVFRSSVMRSNELQYDTSLRVGEDILLFIRCILAGARVALLPEPHYHYIGELRRSSLRHAELVVRYLRAAARLAWETPDNRDGTVMTVRRIVERGIADEVIRRLLIYRTQSIRQVLSIHHVPRLQYLKSFLRLLKQVIRLRIPRIATWPLIRTARLESRSTTSSAGRPRS